MNVLGSFQRWRRNSRRQSAAGKPENALREFVYLDDVSVYSLTASRLGSIATEFTNTETSTLGAEVEASLEASTVLAKGGTRSKASATREQTGQVLRKSIVQTAFKDLRTLEAPRLAMATTEAEEPPALSEENVPASDGRWVIDAEALKRGRLVEVEVELETEAIFRFNAIFSVYLDILVEDLAVFGVRPPAEVPQVRAINRILERLLAGLVPLRGRAVDYAVVTSSDRDVIVHRRVLEQLPTPIKNTSRDLIIVGVAEQRNFWKDIRRVLFSGSRYRVFCRVSEPGLSESWTPVKMTQVLKDVAPQFEGQLLGALGESSLEALGHASQISASGQNEKLLRAANSFAIALVREHGRELTPELQSAVTRVTAEPGYSLESVDEARKFFAELQRLVDDALGVKTTPEVALSSRMVATLETGMGAGAASVAGTSETAAGLALGPRFLDTEIVAIYW